MTVYKVTRPDLGTKQSCAYRNFAEIASEFDGAETGDRITVELDEMSEQEFEALGDFAGW